MYLRFFLTFLLFLGISLPALAQSQDLIQEYKLVNLINRYRRRNQLPTLQLHAAASTVMREHSQEMRNENYFNLLSPNFGSLDYRLAYARIESRALHRFIALDYNVNALYNQLIKNPAFKADNATHIAIGLAEGDHPKYGQALWATLVMLEQMAEMSEIPREIDWGQALKFQVKLESGFSNPRVPVTLPDGQVLTYPPRQQRQGQFQFEIPFRGGKGRYTLELLVDQIGKGPRVASILPLYVGQSYPRKEPAHQSPENPQFNNTAEAAKYLVKRVNQERQKQGLAELTPSQELSLVAYDHSQDMARRKFFAHVNPEGLDPNQRFHRAGGKGQVGENIAYDLNIEDAHRHLMGSPGHRANILHAHFTHMGIGVYFDGSHYYVTQLFQTRHKPIAPQQLSAQLNNWVQKYRQRYKRSVIRQEALFSEAARVHAQAMAEQDQLAYRIANQDFSDRYLQYGGRYQEMKTLILTAYSYQDALAKMSQYQNTILDARWTKYGLGVVRSDSVELGENTLWITMGLARD